ncbi:MAG TPA: S41 family peptidase [Paucimonas sp.]|nr:S41 family peptidase [Paucimonas sp.]
MQGKKIWAWSAAIGGALLAGAIAAVITGVVPFPLGPQRMGPPQNDMAIDQAARNAVLANLVARLDEEYVFADKAKEIGGFLLAQRQAGRYDAITSAEKFAETLTEDLRQVSKDGHLAVHYSEKPIPEEQAREGKQADQIPPEMMADMVRLNFGFERIERLPFNIGYLEMRTFAPGPQAAARIAAAMTLLQDTSALIIDLRANNGGSPDTVGVLAGHLFERRTRLNDIYTRKTDHTEERWSDDSVTPKYGERKKVYILTSRDTFSAAEDFSYAMKNLKRATIIGEATGGGAHPGEPRRLHAHFEAFLPTGRSISPITQGDWEGTGVLPDVQVPADDALDEAQVRILRERLASEQDASVKRRIERRIGELD